MKKTIVLKKAMALVLALLTMVTTMTVVPFTAAAVEADVTIGTPAELLAFKQQIADGNDFAGKVIQLTADIDMSGVDNWPLEANAFKGTFDGNGHTIQNLNATNTGINAAGLLFGLLYGATVKNLSMVGGTYTSSRMCTSIIAGATQPSDTVTVLENLYINYTVEQTAGNDGAILLARAEGSTEIKNCVVDGTINYAGTAMLAGVVARPKGSSVTLSITDCAFLGTINCNNSRAHTGVFWGYNENADVTLTNCANLGTVNYNGGGVNTDEAPFVDTITSENFDAMLTSKYAAWTQTGAAEMMPASVAAMIGKTYTPSVGVDVTIGTPAELLAFKQQIVDGNDFAGKVIQLTADIDMSGVDNWPLEAKAFKGTFDGNGHTIQNLNATNTGINAAGLLFGLLYGATVKNLSMVGGTYTSSRMCTSIIAGATQPSDTVTVLENLYINYTVEQTAGNDGAILLARAEGNTVIKNCVVDGTINYAGSAMLAGVVARPKGSGVTLSITDCAFLGTINCNNPKAHTGVFWGYNENVDLTLTNCANLGTVNYNGGGVNTDEAPFVDTITSENFDAMLTSKYAAWTQTGATEMMPASVAKMLGKKYIPSNLYYQCGTELNEDGTVDVRFISVIDSLTYAQVGFNITISRTANGNTETSAKIPFTTTTVYESITALGETVTAEELGGKYIVAVVVKGIDCANYTHEFAVEAFVKDTLEGAATITASGVVSVEKGLA